MPTKKAGSGGNKGGVKTGKQASRKKTASKKSAAKKGATKKASAKKAAVKTPASGPGRCGNWRAWLDTMPGPSSPTLHVTGRCVMPTPGYRVRLVKAAPQGINPAILLLRKVVTPPKGIVIQVLSPVEVRFSMKTRMRYTNVTILPDGVTVKVRIVS